ncbi:unnamed protein product [marine sediment metagenome]|uniref:Uncharacterized protein n=1 Tax=marine sediment metagenome TaxID=412755 RepID=X1VCV4_9ZZZZ
MNDWIIRLIGLIVSVASPELRKTLDQWLITLEETAKKTPNKWDDILVGMLRQLLTGK